MGSQEVNPVVKFFTKALAYLHEEAQKHGLIESDLKSLADNDFELGDTLVRELMVPRIS